MMIASNTPGANMQRPCRNSRCSTCCAAAHIQSPQFQGSKCLCLQLLKRVAMLRHADNQQAAPYEARKRLWASTKQVVSVGAAAALTSLLAESECWRTESACMRALPILMSFCSQIASPSAAGSRQNSAASPDKQLLSLGEAPHAGWGAGVAGRTRVTCARRGQASWSMVLALANFLEAGWLAASKECEVGGDIDGAILTLV